MLKSGAKILSFFLIGVILLRNYHHWLPKNQFRVAKSAEFMAKEPRIYALHWQIADSSAKMVAKTQITDCYLLCA